MASLSSLIVQRQVATVLEVEQAISRQVIHGGDLLTNLLEVAPHTEQGMNAVLGESIGLPPAPSGRLPAPDGDTLGLVSSGLSLEHLVFPLYIERGALVVATPRVIDPTVEETLAFSLSLDIRQLACTPIRVREGIAAHYGIPLDPRQLRIIHKLDGRPEPMGRNLRELSPPGGFTIPSLPEQPSVLPSTFESGLPSAPPEIEISEVPISEAPPALRASPPPPMEDATMSATPDTTPEAEPPLSRDDTPQDADGMLDPPNEFASSPPEAASTSIAPSSRPPPPRIISSIPVPDRLTDVDMSVRARAEVMMDDRPRDTVTPPSDDEPLPPTVIPSGVAPKLSGDTWQDQPRVEEPVLERPVSEEPASERPLSEPPFPEPPFSEPPETPRVVEVPNDEAARDAAEPSEASVAPRAEAPPEHAIATPRTVPPPDEASPSPPRMIDKRALANVLRRELVGRKPGKTARRKGPFSRDDAEVELERASAPEAILDVYFAFASQFFGYAAMFVVHGDLAEGRDAWGPGADRDKIAGLGVPLDLPSCLSRVRAQKTFLITKMTDPVDRELSSDLGRPDAGKLSVALVPIVVRQRVVAILYGDDGDVDVALGPLGDLVSFTALAERHVERVILEKKRGPAAASRPADRAPRSTRKSTAEGARVLARVVGVAPQEPEAEVRVSPGAQSIVPPTPPSHGYERQPSGQIHASLGALAAVGHYEQAFSSAPPAERVGGAAFEPTEFLHGPSDTSPRTEDSLESSFSPVLPAVAPNTDPRATLPRDLPRRVTPQRDMPGRSTYTYDEEAFREDSQAGSRVPYDPRPREELKTWLGVGEQENRAIPREDDEDASRVILEHTEQTPSTSGPVPSSRERRGAGYAIIQPRSHEPKDAPLNVPSLLSQAMQGGSLGEEAISALLIEAEQHLARIVALFPGPLLVDRFRARGEIPLASECGPLLKLLVLLRRQSVPFMTVRSTVADVDQRFWATAVLGELVFPEASTAILPRLFDDDVMVRRIAKRSATALVAAGAPGEPLRVSLANMALSSDETVDRRVLAVDALGEMRVASVVPILIEALETRFDEIVEASRRSLLLVTRTDLGTSRDAWYSWWADAQHLHRIEWLIEALTHELPNLRRAAGEELKSLTNEYFGYYDDLPPREREKAQVRYRIWWDDEGRFKFA